MFSQSDDITLYGQVLDLDRTQQIGRPAGAQCARITRPRSGPDRETIRHLAGGLFCIMAGILALYLWPQGQVKAPSHRLAPQAVLKPATSPAPYSSGLLILTQPIQPLNDPMPANWIANTVTVGYPVCPPAPAQTSSADSTY